MSETSIIDIRDGSNTVAAPFNTLRHGFQMVGLYDSVLAFGGWNTASSTRLDDFEMWNPTEKKWVKGGKVFQSARSQFGMVMVSITQDTCATSYEQWTIWANDQIDAGSPLIPHHGG